MRDSVMQDTIFLKKMKVTSTARAFYANLFNFSLERLVGKAEKRTIALLFMKYPLRECLF